MNNKTMKEGQLIHGDCIQELRKLPADSIHSVVTDPPAGIGFMGKKWDDKGDLNGFQEFIYQSFKEVYRVMKPGAHGLVWALPRTSHHTAMGLERAGFDIRDCVYYIFGSGFPKSHNIAKATNGPEWEGWGTALKPAVECWWLIRKPTSESSIAKNVLKHGVGGINIDESRIPLTEGEDISIERKERKLDTQEQGWGFKAVSRGNEGRFPSHLIHDGSEEVVSMFPKSKSIKSNRGGARNTAEDIYGQIKPNIDMNYECGYNDQGSASRFFKVCEVNKDCPFCYTYTRDNNKEIRCLNSNKNVHNVKRTSGNTNLIGESIALKSATLSQNEKLVQLVRFVGNLCDLCGTHIVQELVKIKTLSSQEESQAIQDFIGDYKKCILLLNLANCVEELDSIDTTPTTKNLLKLFGYVLPAIKNYIQEIEKSELKRLIYQPKASKSERNEGLEGFEEKQTTGGGGGVGDYLKDVNSASGKYGSEKAPAKNYHPTVKPKALMKYLVRLITPKGGTVLDPFMGSGSTGIACKELGFNFIGIELEEDYYEIAKARINNTKETLL